jgi:hypothetical protein
LKYWIAKGPRVFFSSGDGLKVLAIRAVFRTFVWGTPGAVAFFILAAIDKADDLEAINWVFLHAEQIAWIGIAIGLVLGLAELVRSLRWKAPDLAVLTLELGTLPWTLMRWGDRWLRATRQL